MGPLVYVAVLVAGVLNAVHSGTNATLQHQLERPWWAALIVLIVSALVVAVGIAISREGLPGAPALANVPWWAWAGTAAGAIPAISSLLFARALGGAAYNGIVVTSTILASILLDNFGLLGFETHPVNILRLLGAALMIGGLALVCLF